MGMKPFDIASTQVALMQPLVVSPVMISVSTPFAVSVDAREVPKNALATVEEVKDERTRQIAKPILRNKWFWIGGVTASSVAAFLFFSKNQGSALLPEAPDPPGSP